MVTVAADPIRQELLSATAHRHARLFRIARTDGVVLRFTEHSAPIEFDGETYLPTNGANASASVTRSGLGESSLEASGFVDDTSITEEDLRAGRYRDAEVLEILIDWRFPFVGALQVSRLWIQSTKLDDGWSATCGGIAERLKAKLGGFLERSCQKKFGDMATCRFDIVPGSRFYAPVSHVLSAREFRVESLGSTVLTGEFDYGEAVWRTGENAGLTFRIQSYDAANQLVTLGPPVPLTIAVGDRVDLIQGCNRLPTRCKQLGNFVNFGGLPNLPTTDEQIKPATG